jgi:UDP-N-acetylmuramoylalanine--D-glutamate ligase
MSTSPPGLFPPGSFPRGLFSSGPFPAGLFSGKRFAVVGLGKNGLPAALALRAMGAEVAAWDDNAASRAAAQGAGQGLDLRDPMDGAFDFDALVLSPGIPHRLPKPHPVAVRAIAAGVPILSDVELLFQAVRASGSRARFVGITGTNGKSTTTALLAHILQQAGRTVVAGANLGPAALSLPLLPDDGVYVLEMSSYLLERIATVRFDGAIMLNLSADHIDRHGDMAGYAMAKRAVFDRQAAGDLAVIGVDDPGSREMASWLETKPARVERVSGAQVPLAAGPALPGAHNAQNAAAATAMARFLGVADDVIAAGLASYPGHQRQQGDQRGCDRTRPGLLRPDDLDRWRHGQGRRDRAAGPAVPAYRPCPVNRPRCPRVRRDPGAPWCPVR